MKQRLALAAIVGAMVLLAGFAAAQRYRGSHRYSRTARGDWAEDAVFPKDVFTFVRVEYTSAGGYSRYGYRRRGGGCWTDYPDSDLNFSFRLQQLTSLKVNPEPKVLRLTEPELFDYPFIYIVNPDGKIIAKKNTRRGDNLTDVLEGLK